MFAQITLAFLVLNSNTTTCLLCIEIQYSVFKINILINIHLKNTSWKSCFMNFNKLQSGFGCYLEFDNCVCKVLQPWHWQNYRHRCQNYNKKNIPWQCIRSTLLYINTVVIFYQRMYVIYDNYFIMETLSKSE